MSEDQKTENVEQVEFIEEATSEVEETQQDPVETETTESDTSPDEPNEGEEGDDVPKDNAAWAKMRAENKRLRDAVAGSQVDAEYLKELEQITGRQDYQPQFNPKDIEEMDQTSREVAQAREDARRAVIEANNNRREVEDMIAEERFPQLKEDPVFRQLVSEKRLVSEVLGKRKTTVQIAEEVSKLLGIQQKQAEITADQKARQAQAQRAVATAETRSAPSQGRSTYSDEEASVRIARGDQQFTQEHLKNKYLNDLPL